jgi:Trk K+ transport system NAD-binding subunit
MDNTKTIKDLIDKVQNDTSTSEEELALLQYINDASRLMVIVANAIKSDQLKEAIKDAQPGHGPF